jgi:hypothetical protein
VALMRNDDGRRIWDSRCDYDHARVLLDPVTDLPTLGALPPQRAPFVGADGAPKVTAVDRRHASRRAPVFEDLRFAVYRGRAPDNALLTGVTLQRAMCDPDPRSAVGVFELGPDQTLRWLHDLPSPDDRAVEKNWLFVQTQDAEFDVLHSFAPLRVLSYNHKLRTLEPKRTVHATPAAWPKAEYRLSACALLGAELMLLLHCKDPLTTRYVFYCLYLDADTHEPRHCVPSPVMADVGIRVFFPMSVTATPRHYHFSCGVNDRVAGILTYAREEWDSLRVAC